MHDSTSLAKKLNSMKSMHKSLNEKYNESANIIFSLKTKNSMLTSKINEMPSNTNDHTKKDNLISSMKCRLKELKDEIRSLKSENSNLTSRLQNIDDISSNMNILKAKNIKLRNTNQDMLKKFYVLEDQAQVTSSQSSHMINEHTEIKKELKKYKSIVEKFTFISERLNMLLKDQRAIFNHADLGYKLQNK